MAPPPVCYYITHVCLIYYCYSTRVFDAAIALLLPKLVCTSCTPSYIRALTFWKARTNTVWKPPFCVWIKRLNSRSKRGDYWFYNERGKTRTWPKRFNFIYNNAPTTVTVPRLGRPKMMVVVEKRQMGDIFSPSGPCN